VGTPHRMELAARLIRAGSGWPRNVSGGVDDERRGLGLARGAGDPQALSGDAAEARAVHTPP
jgi:hypothetical protein